MNDKTKYCLLYIIHKENRQSPQAKSDKCLPESIAPAPIYLCLGTPLIYLDND